VRDRKSALNTWFIDTYKARYGTYPSGPAYQYAQGVLAAKVAYDRAAAANGGAFPNQDQVMAALNGATFESFSTTVAMSPAGGHQAVTEHVYGRTKYNWDTGEPDVVDIQFFKGECVMPPDGVSSVDWVTGDMKETKC
jgi:branched-chain amino acid transport system substrate-binding protein